MADTTKPTGVREIIEGIEPVQWNIRVSFEGYVESDGGGNLDWDTTSWDEHAHEMRITGTGLSMDMIDRLEDEQI